MPGPALLGIAKGILSIGDKVIDRLVPDKGQAARLKHELSLVMQSDNHELRMLEQQLEADMHTAQQATIQAELHQSDLYTKQTRPKIARWSFYAGMVYVLLSSIPEDGIWVFKPWQMQWEVLILLYSPALTYMGVRGFEKWKAGGSG